MINLPFTGAPKESMDVTLDGRKLRIRARYSNLINVWSISIYDIGGDATVALVEGVAVVIGADLIEPYALKLGGLFAEPTESTLVDAGRGELGVRVKLVYYTTEEMAATA
jgi:hypothetical protein